MAKTFNPLFSFRATDPYIYKLEYTQSHCDWRLPRRDDGLRAPHAGPQLEAAQKVCAPCQFFLFKFFFSFFFFFFLITLLTTHIHTQDEAFDCEGEGPKVCRLDCDL